MYLSISINESEANSIIRDAFMRIFTKCEFDTMPLFEIFGKEFRYICNVDLKKLRLDFESSVIDESKRIKIVSFEDFKK